MKGSMKKVAAGIAATLLVALFGQSAMADSYTITTYTTTPFMTERVIESPVVLSSPATCTYRTIDNPVVIRENPVVIRESSPVIYRSGDSHHLLNFGLFPLMHLKVF